MTWAERSPLAAAVTVADLERDPHRVLAELRAREPVSWVPALGAWLVTERATALAVMRDAATFTVDDPRFSTARVVGPSMLSLDGADHDRHRAPFARPFRHRAVEEQLAGWVRAEARRAVGRTAPSGRAELREAVAAPLAVAVVSRALGLVDTDPDRILGWYRAIVAAVGRVEAGLDVGDAGWDAVDDLRAAVAATIAAGEPSLLGAVAATGTLAPDEVFSNAAVVMFGGIETSEGMTAGALLHLLSHPDQLDEVRRDRSLVADAVEESLRLEPAAALVDRYATRDVVLGDAEIAAGDRVSISLAGANRDPAVFADPDRFDLRRPNARLHLAFVHGPHACLGSHLARLETAAAIEAVLDLLPGVRLDRSATAAHRGLIFRKPPSVTATWDTG